jgi:hypothetical protein
MIQNFHTLGSKVTLNSNVNPADNWPGGLKLKINNPNLKANAIKIET